MNTKLLKQLRKEKNLTQEELAVKVGIGQTFISKIERGHFEPSIPTLRRIAKVLGVSPAELLK